ncbi:MAG: hypothetical protein ACXWXM_05440 [Actinomycetota bacterium]
MPRCRRRPTGPRALAQRSLTVAPASTKLAVLAGYAAALLAVSTVLLRRSITSHAA